ncbi:hypothetical protein LSH36_14g12090 [Paralvinella palmiformis]|uniref:G-protein coupled receptors family 1 profile domain-containing protein n=1 Tax=Paralvinella palmiformis TaxID=53620 RepID=A0AAD9KDQ9_9ANNE|nr:hypothetical protein LSH36_14g12090 [Paralvinella palmiformis]
MESKESMSTASDLDVSVFEDEMAMNSIEEAFLTSDTGQNLTMLWSVLENATLDMSYSGDFAFQRAISVLHVYVLPIIILIGILGNTVSFLVYVGTPRLCRQSSSMYLAFLAAVDNVSLVSVFVVWFGWVGIHIFHKNGWCQTILYCMYVCSFLSVWTVVSFTCERWIVVFHPLKRHRLCTRKRAIVVMSTLTISALAFYTFSVFTTRVQYANDLPFCSQSPEYKSVLQVISSIDTMCTVILPSLAIVVMNTGIGIKTCRYTNRRSNSPPHASQNSIDEMFSNYSSHRNSETRPAPGTTSALSAASHSRVLVTATNRNTSRQWRFFTRRQQTQLRITRALLIVSSVFVLLNLPSYAFRIHAFVITIRQEAYEISFQAFIWQEFIQFLYYINQSSNFFLYCACSRNFRFALKRLFCRFKSRLLKLRHMSWRGALHNMFAK